MSESNAPIPIWHWSLEQVQTVTCCVHAGKDLTPNRWPNGARVAVTLSFDLDAETGWLRRGLHSPSAMSRGAYGARVGIPRILNLLDRYDLPATFFVPAVAAQLHPGVIDDILESARHEIGVHGWIHELAQELSGAEEFELLSRSFDLLKQRIGKSPAGIRTPSWDFTPHTMGIIRKLGFIYDSSLMGDDRPYELVAGDTPTGVVELPVEWLLDDHPYFNIDHALHNLPYIQPEDVRQIWQAEFEMACREGTLFLLTMHPQVIGHRSRLAMLEKLIRNLRDQSGVWFATHEAIAQYVLEQAGGQA